MTKEALVHNDVYVPVQTISDSSMDAYVQNITWGQCFSKCEAREVHGRRVKKKQTQQKEQLYIPEKPTGQNEQIMSE